MSNRSYSDVPNRIINLFLQEAGERYDLLRQLQPYRKMTPDLLARFGNACAYCASRWEVEDHLVPRNRRAAGLHAWGNVVPACRACNLKKKDLSWEEHLRAAVSDTVRCEAAHARIASYIADFEYTPDTAALKPFLDSLYQRADRMARELVGSAIQETDLLLRALNRAASVRNARESETGKSKARSAARPARARTSRRREL